MPRLRPVPAVVALLAALSLAPLSEADAEDGLVPVTQTPVLASAVDVRGTVVAFASPAAAQIEIRLLDIENRTERVVTTVPRAGPNTTVSSLAFDGRWIAWSDDRFGQDEVFAVQSDGTGLRRITDRPEPDSSVDVDAGVVVWARDADVRSFDTATGNESLVRADAGLVAAPTVGRGLIAWSESENGTRSILGRRVDGTAMARLAPGGATFETRPHLGGDLMVWTGIRLGDPGGGGGAASIIRLGVFSESLQDAAAGTIPPLRIVDLTPPLLVRDPQVAGTRVVWSALLPDRTVGVSGLNMETGTPINAAPPVLSARISESHLVVVHGESPVGTVGTLAAYAWPPEHVRADRDGFSWPLVLGGAGLIAAGIWWGMVRARRRGSA